MDFSTTFFGYPENVYVIEGDLWLDEEGKMDENIMDAYYNLKVTVNGQQQTEFGENWAGTIKYNESSVLSSAIAEYINEDKTTEFVYVSDEIKEAKEKFQSHITVADGIEVPAHYISELGDTADLSCVIKTDEGEIHKYYLNGYVTVRTNTDGSIWSKNEGFVTDSLYKDVNEGKILYQSEKIDLSSYKDDDDDDEDEE